MYEMLSPITDMAKQKPAPTPALARFTRYGSVLFMKDATHLMALQKDGRNFSEYHATVSLGEMPGSIKFQLDPGPAPDGHKLRRVYASTNSVFVIVYNFFSQHPLDVEIDVDCPVYISRYGSRIVAEMDITPALMTAGS